MCGEYRTCIFGGGYPKNEAQRKIADANKLKEIRTNSQIDFQTFMDGIDDELTKKVRGLIKKTKH